MKEIHTDRYGRRFRGLRISLTASCNYACSYCVPNGQNLLKKKDELSIKKMRTAVRLLKESVHLEKIKITGGEPLISDKFDDLLESISTMKFSDVSITTNGQFLLDKIDHIHKNGIRRINVSLDTLDEEKFKKITRGGDLKKVLEGIRAAIDLGILVKINMIPMRGKNDGEILSMLDFCIKEGAQLRYIELMQMGHLAHSVDFNKQFIGMQEILKNISSCYSFKEGTFSLDSTAQKFIISENSKVFGIIPNSSQPFCTNCTRLRLTSNGLLYGCLSNQKNYDIKPLLSMPFNDALEKVKPVLESALKDKQMVSFKGETTVMKFIGG